MPKNAWKEVLDDELRNWSGVVVDMGDSARHERATFYVGVQKKFIHMSRGSNNRDGGRALKNFRSQIRRLMKEMGAQELT